MALTITSVGNGTSTTNNTTLATGATVTANVGDTLLICIAASNDGTSGVARTVTITDSEPGTTNVYTQRGTTGNYTAGTAGDGASQYFFECFVDTALINDTITITFSGNVAQKAVQVYRMAPGTDEKAEFVSVGTASTGAAATSHSAATVSVTSGHTIFAMAAIETDDTITGDTDTTNGSWSTILTRLADGGADASTMSCSSQYKTVNATGNQSWAATTATGRDSARNYIIYQPRPAYRLNGTSQSYSASTVSTSLQATRFLTATDVSYSASTTSAVLTKNSPFTTTSQSVSVTTQAADFVFDSGVNPLNGYWDQYTAPTWDSATTQTWHNFPLAGSYTLTATAQSYSVSTVSGSFVYGRGLVATSQSYSASSVTTILKAGRRLTGTTQTYSVSTVSALLALVRRITATTRTYAVSTVSTVLKAARKLAGTTQTYAETTNTASLLASRKVSATAQSYSVSAQTANVKAGYVIVIDDRGYSVVPYDANLDPTGVVNVSPAAYAVQGKTSMLYGGRKVYPLPQSYVIDAQSSTLTAIRKPRYYIIT